MDSKTREFLQDISVIQQDIEEEILPMPFTTLNEVFTIPYIDNIENGNLLYLLSHSKLKSEVFKTKLNIINLTNINHCPYITSGLDVLNIGHRIINPNEDDMQISDELSINIHPPNTLINNQILTIHSNFNYKIQSLSPMYLCNYDHIEYYYNLQQKMITKSKNEDIYKFATHRDAYENMFNYYKDEFNTYNLLDEELYNFNNNEKLTLADLCGSLEARGFKGTIIFNGCRIQDSIVEASLARKFSNINDKNVTNIAENIEHNLNISEFYLDINNDLSNQLFRKHRRNSLTNLYFNKVKIKENSNIVIDFNKILFQYFLLNEMLKELSTPLILSALTKNMNKIRAPSPSDVDKYDYLCQIKDKFKYFSDLEEISLENYLIISSLYDLQNFDTISDIQNKLTHVLINTKQILSEEELEMKLKELLEYHRNMEDKLLDNNYINHKDISSKYWRKDLYYVVRPNKEIINSNPFEYLYEIVRLRERRPHGVDEGGRDINDSILIYGEELAAAGRRMRADEDEEPDVKSDEFLNIHIKYNELESLENIELEIFNNINNKDNIIDRIKNLEIELIGEINSSINLSQRIKDLNIVLW